MGVQINHLLFFVYSVYWCTVFVYLLFGLAVVFAIALKSVSCNQWVFKLFTGTVYYSLYIVCVGALCYSLRKCCTTNISKVLYFAFVIEYGILQIGMVKVWLHFQRMPFLIL